MTKLSLVFFTPLILILLFRILTFSPVPIAEGCEVEKTWNLNRIENFSGLTDGLDSFESKKVQKILINFFVPSLLTNSQILVEIKCNEENEALIYNNLRDWKGQEKNLITVDFEAISIFERVTYVKPGFINLKFKLLETAIFIFKSYNIIFT